jgi:hypothetical protein
MDEAEGRRRCALLTAQGQYCAVSVIPQGEAQAAPEAPAANKQGMLETDTPPKG